MGRCCATLRTERRRSGILRSLIDKVTLTPSDDHFAIGLEGALAGMLALAQTGKWPRGIAVSEVFRSSVSGPRHR